MPTKTAGVGEASRDWATMLGQHPFQVRAAAFLRTHARRLEAGEEWDSNDDGPLFSINRFST